MSYLYYLPLVFLLLVVLDTSAATIKSHVFITILQCCLMRSLVDIENFLLFSLGALSLTIDSNTILVKLSFKLCFHLPHVL